MPLSLSENQLAVYQQFCQGALANPYAVHRWLRSEEPMHWSDGFNGGLLTR